MCNGDSDLTISTCSATQKLQYRIFQTEIHAKKSITKTIKIDHPSQKKLIRLLKLHHDKVVSTFSIALITSAEDKEKCFFSYPPKKQNFCSTTLGEKLLDLSA